jgi:predicted kinase
MSNKPRPAGLMHASTLVDMFYHGTPTVVLLVGPPASGKSTVSNELEKRGFIRLSQDVIRGELYGDESVMGNQSEVKALFLKRYEAALLEKKCILIDNTNCHYGSRRSLVRKARDAGYKRVVLVVMRTPLRECLRRNAARARVVPEMVIRSMFKDLNDQHYVRRNEGIVIDVKPGPDAEHVHVTFPFRQNKKT